MDEFYYPFNNYSTYLKKKYNKAAYRVAVDAGFSCPNRGTDRNNPGCTYCEIHGARAVYTRNETSLKIKDQVEKALIFLKKRYKAEVFLLYFQAFSNTYADIDVLREIYDYSLSLADFSEFIVSTRPDCLDKDKIKLLSSYKKENFDVWVELGLQSALNTSLNNINRGHTVNDFISTFNLLKEAGIKQSVHLIFGLPGESWKDIEKTMKLICQLKPEAVKIHNLHIPFDTEIFKDFQHGELSISSSHRHMEYTIKALEMLPSNIIIQRLTCDTDKEKLAAPKNKWKKGTFYENIRKEMLRLKTSQGSENID